MACSGEAAVELVYAVGMATIEETWTGPTEHTARCETSDPSSFVEDMVRFWGVPQRKQEEGPIDRWT